MRYLLLVSAALTALTASPIRAKQPSMRFDAKASVACGFVSGTLGQCSAAVMRGGPGRATVRILPLNGGERHIYFENGGAVSSDGERRIAVSRHGRVSLIRIGHEWYELPDSFVWGS